MQDNRDVEQQIEAKINLSRELSQKLQSDFCHCDGATKIKRLIDNETKFFSKLKTNFEEEKVARQLMCTNLIFYEHLINSLYVYREIHTITAISSVQRRNSDDKTVRVDIVCDDKQEILWIKIIARNSSSLIDCAQGRCMQKLTESLSNYTH
jgi:hypothetical protein